MAPRWHLYLALELIARTRDIAFTANGIFIGLIQESGVRTATVRFIVAHPSEKSHNMVSNIQRRR
jgi:hypothetical protein